MILVTVGAQMPFPRLVDAVDAWAAENPDVEVLAQISSQDPPPTHLPHVDLLSPDELRDRIAAAEVVVAHAGMGTIITCLELGTPLIVLAREGKRRETRNDHQRATVERFGTKPGIWAADDAAHLAKLLDERGRMRSVTAEAPATSAPLLDTIRRFVDA
jgi:UDP-N-acetylglucosamine transferase subunit ALG13